MDFIELNTLQTPMSTLKTFQHMTSSVSLHNDSSLSLKPLQLAPLIVPCFLRIGGGYNMDKMKDIEMIFNEVLEPLYGSQAKAIKQIRESTDRICFLLYENDQYCKPVAVLCFKTDPTDEFAYLGVKRSIEIKSLFVYHPKENSGKGYASMLIEKLKLELTDAWEKGSIQGIHVTVSEKVPESLAFFAKKEFGIAHTWYGRYIDGVQEHLLRYIPFTEPTSPVIPGA